MAGEMVEECRRVDNSLTPTERERILARLQSLGWTPPAPVPFHVFMDVARAIQIDAALQE